MIWVIGPIYELFCDPLHMLQYSGFTWSKELLCATSQGAPSYGAAGHHKCGGLESGLSALQ